MRRTATVNIYKDAYSSEYKTVKITSELTVEEVLGKDFDYQNSVVVCNGQLVEKDYRIHDNDLICVRTFPSSATTIGIIALVAVAVVVVGAVGLALALHYNWGGIRDKFVNWLLGDQDETSNESNENEKIPTIKGCRNRSMLGKPIPIVLGKTLMTPGYCGNPYTSISGTDGEEQVYIASFVLGYAPLEVTDIKLGELILSENVNHVENGTIPVSAAEGSAGRFVGNVWLEIKSGTSAVPADYPKKIVQENLDFQLLYPEDSTPLKVERFTSTFPMRVQVELCMNALYQMDDEGNKSNYSTEVILAISFDGGATYVPFASVDGATSTTDIQITNSAGTVIGTGRKSVITRNKNKQMRFVATRDLTWSEAVNLHGHGNDVAQIFLQKGNTDPIDGKKVDAIYCTAIRTWTYDYDRSVSAGAFVAEDLMPEKMRKKVVCLTMKMKASNSFADLNGTINELTCKVKSKCRTWNGSAWSSTVSATDNPAAVALALMQSKSLGSYAIPDEKIDLASFGELYEFVEAHTGKRAGSDTPVSMPFAIGGALTSQKKLIDSVNNVLLTARASLVMNGTLYSVLIDKPRDYPVTILNNHSFLKDGLSNTKSFDELPDGYKVKFINERLDYTEDFIFVMVGSKTSTDPTAVIEETEVLWITNPDLVWQYTVYNHAKRKCRPETWNRKVSLDGNLIEIGNLVSIQDDTILVGIGDGGEIKDLVYNSTRTSITGVVIDGEIGVSDTTKTYGVKIVIADGTHEPTVLTKQVEITEAKYYSKFMFETPISLSDEIKPAIGDILSFGVLDRITYDVLCSYKKDNGDGTFDMQFMPYDERVYTADTEGIPEFNSKMTSQPVMEETNQIPPDYVKKSDYVNSVNLLLYGVVSGTDPSIQEPDDVTNVVAKAYRDQIEITWDFSGLGLSNTIESFAVVITKKDGTEVTVYPADTRYTYMFQRFDSLGVEVDGYPEADDLEDWTVTVTPKNVYGKVGNTTTAVYVNADADHYGTWLFGQAVPDVKIQQNNSTGRVLQATFSMPPRSDLRQLYGTIRYRVQIQRRLEQGYTPVGQEDYDAADEWWAPATSADPYSGENNYKYESADPDYIVAQETYLQTLPLVGQSYVGEGKTQNTPYRIRVSAENEAGTSGWAYPVPFTATVTGIFDLVKANENFKELYVSELSSICANLGRITGGTMAGGEFNYWTLETLINAHPDTVPPILNKDFMGAFSVGDDNQHLRVIPQIDIDGRTILGYEIIFKVGKFEISSSYSKLNGEFIIQTNEESLERTRLTPYGTYFESRKLPTDNEWNVIAKQDVAGTLTKMVYSENDSLVISNQGISSRREANCDIGREYLSSNSLVYHFDVDSLDQYGGSGLTVTKATGAPDPVYVDDEDSEHYGINMAPAIIREAPYSEIGKSLYGLYSLEHSLGTGSKWTVDVWIKYVWAEDQELMRVEVGNDVLLIVNETSEPNYNEPQEGEPPYNTDTVEPEGKPYNVAASSGCVLVYNNTHKIQLKDIGLLMETDNWYHIAVVLNNGTLTFMGSSDATLATLNPVVKVDLATQGSGGTVTFNSSKESFLCDELFIDTTVAETDVKFLEGSSTKIPWAANSYDADYFILNKSNNSRLITNLFDDDLFKQKVQALFNEYNKYEIGFIQEFGGPDDKVPLGWFPCRWQAISRTTYAVLFGVIGTYWGAGDGSTTFNLPDSREISFVGISKCSNPNHYIYDNTEVNPATGTVGNQDHDVYTLGEFKDDQFQQHKHSLTYAHRHGGSGQTLNQGTYGDQVSNYDDGTSWPNSGRYGTTTHGKRVGVNYIIRVF